jgi:hypothetical protein
MASKRQRPHKRSSLADRFIEHLQRDIEFYRTEYLFLKGKVERLELATFSQGNTVAKEYAQRTDERQIIDVPVEQPKKKTWKQVQEEWANLTPEQQEEAIAKGAN